MRSAGFVTVAAVMAVLATAAQAESISWLGSAGGEWNEPASWDRGRVPAFGDGVTIALPAGTEVVLRDVDANVSTLTMSGALRIERAQLSVVGPSTLSGTLTLGPGGGLVANGDQAVLTVTGTTAIAGGSVLALAGGRVSLPGVSSLVGGATIRAEGLGSVIALPNLGSAGLPPATTPLLFEAASRSVSVFNREAPLTAPLALIDDAVSRPLSIFNRFDATSVTSPLPTAAVSRAVSLFNRFDAAGDSTPAIPGDAVSRTVGIANLPQPSSDPLDLIDSALSRELSVDNDPTE